MYLMPQPGGCALPYPRRPRRCSLSGSSRRRFLLGQTSPSLLSLPTLPTSATVPAPVDATAIAQAICQKNGKCPGGSNPFMNDLIGAIQSRFLFAYTPQKSCTATGSSSAATGLMVASAASGAAAKVIAMVAPATGPLAPIVAGIAAVTALIGGIVSHHAKAVATQDDLLCANVPQANQVLQAIDQGLASGSITPAQASQAYQQLASQFLAAMKTDPSYKRGDALWLYAVIVLPAVIQARLQDLANGQITGGAEGPWTTAEGQAAASLGTTPSVLWWIAGGIAAVWLLS